MWICLLYTSDAADERSSVDLGGRRIINKKKKEKKNNNTRQLAKDTRKLWDTKDWTITKV